MPRQNRDHTPNWYCATAARLSAGLGVVPDSLLRNSGVDGIQGPEDPLPLIRQVATDQREMAKWLKASRRETVQQPVTAEEVMNRAPTTLRPSHAIDDALELLRKSARRATLVTSSDGKLMGVFFPGPF